jgi:hypothetical protein
MNTNLLSMNLDPLAGEGARGELWNEILCCMKRLTARPVLSAACPTSLVCSDRKTSFKTIRAISACDFSTDRLNSHIQPLLQNWARLISETTGEKSGK